MNSLIVIFSYNQSNKIKLSFILISIVLFRQQPHNLQRH